jgi:hypothetical protein
MQAASRLVLHSEARLGLGARGSGGTSLANELRGAELDVQPDLLVHVGGGASGTTDGEAEQAPDAGSDITLTHHRRLTPVRRLW